MCAVHSVCFCGKCLPCHEMHPRFCTQRTQACTRVCTERTHAHKALTHAHVHITTGSKMSCSMRFTSLVVVVFAVLQSTHCLLFLSSFFPLLHWLLILFSSAPAFSVLSLQSPSSSALFYFLHNVLHFPSSLTSVFASLLLTSSSLPSSPQWWIRKNSRQIASQKGDFGPHCGRDNWPRSARTGHEGAHTRSLLPGTFVH